jgi:hypothetical protein
VCSATEAGWAAKVDGRGFGVYTQGMVRPDLQKWSLSLSTLTELSISAEHPRTRERLTALVLLSQGQATDGYRGPARCAERLHEVLGRDVHTVLKWVHDFNAGGPAALVYRHTGGTPPRRDMLAPLVREVLDEARTVAAQPVLKKRRSAC